MSWKDCMRRNVRRSGENEGRRRELWTENVGKNQPYGSALSYVTLPCAQ